MTRLYQEIIDQIVVQLPEVEVAPATHVVTKTAVKKSSALGKLVSKLRRSEISGSANSKSLAGPRRWTRASVAVLSREWQRAVEPMTFAKLSIKSSDIEKLQSIVMDRPDRKAHLRSLTAVLAIGFEHWTDLGAKDLLNPLFSVMGGESDTAAIDLLLRFEAGDQALRHIARQGFTCNRVHSKPLTKVHCVKSLDFTPCDGPTEKERRDVLQLHLMEQANLAKYFPNLQAVTWYYTESEKQDVRETMRGVFGSYIAQELPDRPGIKRVSLSLALSSLWQRIQSPNQIGEASYENLWLKLQSATRHVTELNYSAVAGPLLFQPRDDNENRGLRLWPCLRNLTVCMALLSPTGQWYFDGDAFGFLELDTPLTWQPDYATLRPEQHEGKIDGRPFWYRERPEEEHIVPLLEAFASLLEQLPVLETAQIVARRGANEAPPWAVCYCVPGQTSRWIDYSEMDISQPRVWFVTGAWRPSDTLVQRFADAGRGAGHMDGASIIWWSIQDDPVRINV